MALVALACASGRGADAPSYEVSESATLFANDARVATFEAWRESLHFEVPAVDVPSELTLVNAYVYRPDADLDLSLVSLFFEDADEPRRWVLLKFDDRAPFVLLAERSTVANLGAVEGRAGVYVNGAGDRWHDIVFEACGLGVAVKGGADVWTRVELESIARSIVEGCDDPKATPATP